MAMVQLCAGYTLYSWSEWPLSKGSTTLLTMMCYIRVVVGVMQAAECGHCGRRSKQQPLLPHTPLARERQSACLFEDPLIELFWRPRILGGAVKNQHNLGGLVLSTAVVTRGAVLAYN